MFDLVKQLSRASRSRHTLDRIRHAYRPAFELAEQRVLLSTYYVATNGSDANNGLSLGAPFKTIQHGLDIASHAGDTVMVRGGTYHEQLMFSHGGSAAGGYITLQPYGSDHPILDGRGAVSNDIGYGNDMVQIVNTSYVKLIGFEIAYDNGVAVQDDAFGVRVQGSGTNVSILNNLIHDITGSASASVGGAGIHVYGSSLTAPYSNVVISGNTIYACQPGFSETETLTVNGNVTNFQITGNVIHDCNNIGIDMIGGEAAVFGKPDGTLGLPVARNGVCSHNIVYNIHANYGGGFAGGIYVDGGQNITISDNVSYQNDMGIEVGAENHGYVASGILVENNLLYNNYQGGIVFGGYDATRGRVQNCSFINNTVYNSDRANTGQGALQISYASNNIVANNIFTASANNVLINSPYASSNSGNTLDNNLYYSPGGASNAIFSWNGQSYATFATYKLATSQDAHSIFGNPRFVNTVLKDFHLLSNSPAIHAGSSKSGWYTTTDFDGKTRMLPPDIGAYQYVAPGNAALPRTTFGSTVVQGAISGFAGVTSSTESLFSYWSQRRRGLNVDLPEAR